MVFVDSAVLVSVSIGDFVAFAGGLSIGLCILKPEFVELVYCLFRYRGCVLGCEFDVVVLGEFFQVASVGVFFK